MEILLFEKAERDFDFWQKSGNKAIQKKIQQLFKDMLNNPFEGIGKPEALKHELLENGLEESMRSTGLSLKYLMMICVYSLKGHYQ